MPNQTIAGFPAKPRRPLGLQMLNAEGIAPETRHIVRIHKLGEHHRRIHLPKGGDEALHVRNEIARRRHLQRSAFIHKPVLHIDDQQRRPFRHKPVRLINHLQLRLHNRIVIGHGKSLRTGGPGGREKSVFFWYHAGNAD